MFIVEVAVRGGPEPNEIHVATPGEVLRLIDGAGKELKFFCVADVRSGCDWGNFMVWLGGGHARVRLDEHREHYASPPGARQGGSVQFIDTDGSTFDIPLSECVPRNEALRAFTLWLATGKRDPLLAWD